MENLFKNFKQSALRIETLPLYKEDMEDIEYYNFINGEPVEYGDKEWIGNLKRWTSQGKIIKRIRIVSDILTTYEKYEFFCYHKNCLAGEKIFVMPRNEYEKIVDRKDRFDYWIFDESTICKINYNNEGRYLGYTIIEEDAKKYVDLFYLLEKQRIFDYKEVIKKINNSKIKINF